MNNKMVFRLNSFLFLLFVSFTHAQNSSKIYQKSGINAIESQSYVRCATVESEEKLAKTHRTKTTKETFELWMASKISEIKNSNINHRVIDQIYTIPVVIHIIHDGDNVNTPGNINGENISDAQVISQIKVLNQDFRRMEDTPGGENSTGVAVDVGINFSLATQDPYGIETNGIIRHNIIPYTDDVENESQSNAGGGGVDWENAEDVQKMKSETQWDPSKYLNIWTIRTGGETLANDGLSDILGFAQFPDNSGLEGLNENEGSSLTDGIVIAFHSFGDKNQSDGSFILNNIYNEGRTTTHEVGHWFGLRHIWGDTNTCGNDDYCEDTPDTRTPHTDCNLYDTCRLDGLGNDMIENYMDYTPDVCMDTFTQNQKERMITVLNNSPRRIELLNSTALDPPLFTDKDLENYVLDSNPVIDKVTISGFADGIVVLTVSDISGKVLSSKRYFNVEHVFSEEVEVGDLRSGVYLVVIENEGKTVVKRIIKK